MRSYLTVVAPLVAALGVSAQQSGQTTRYWDCCKPSCAWSGKVRTSPSCVRMPPITHHLRLGLRQRARQDLRQQQQPAERPGHQVRLRRRDRVHLREQPAVGGRRQHRVRLRGRRDLRPDRGRLVLPVLRADVHEHVDCGQEAGKSSLRRNGM